MSAWAHMLYICVIVIVATFAYETNVHVPEEIKAVKVVDKAEKRCIVSKYQHGVFESAVKRTD